MEKVGDGERSGGTERGRKDVGVEFDGSILAAGGVGPTSLPSQQRDAYCRSLGICFHFLHSWISVLGLGLCGALSPFFLSFLGRKVGKEKGGVTWWIMISVRFWYLLFSCRS